MSLDDTADGRLGKMCCADHYAAVAVAIEETAARGSGKNGVGVRTHDPLGFEALNGTVDAIAGDDCMCTLGSQMYADMTRRVARRRFEPDLVVQCEVAADKLCLVRRNYGQNAVDEVRLRVLFVQLLEALPLPLGEDVSGVWKRGDPAAVPQSRVPPDVVPMQMRAHDVVDILGSDAGVAQAREKRIQLLHVPKGPDRPWFVVSHAGVDENRMALRAYQECLDGQNDVPGLGIQGPRLHPSPMPCPIVGGGLGKEIQRIEFFADGLDDPLNDYFTEGVSGHGS